MSFKGELLQPVRDESSYTHGQGWTSLREFQGREFEIQGLLWDYINAGWEVRTSREGPYMRFTATRGGADAPETEYYDKFSITKENLQKSIWTLPDVVTDMDAFSLGKQFYRYVVERAVDTGDENTLEADLPIALYPVAWSVYRELCRGADSYETEYIVLSRERVVSVEYFASIPIPPDNASTIYASTAALQAAFDIPNFGSVVWPDATPLTPSGAQLQWGWRTRRREIRWQEGARVEVVQDWVFAEWSTNLYTAA